MKCQADFQRLLVYFGRATLVNLDFATTHTHTHTHTPTQTQHTRIHTRMRARTHTCFMRVTQFMNGHQHQKSFVDLVCCIFSLSDSNLRTRGSLLRAVALAASTFGVVTRPSRLRFTRVLEVGRCAPQARCEPVLLRCRWKLHRISGMAPYANNHTFHRGSI